MNALDRATDDNDDMALATVFEAFRVAHTLLLSRPCELHDGKTVSACREQKRADCQMCQAAELNEPYFNDARQRPDGIPGRR